MAFIDVTTTRGTGQTLYAYPASESLADWTTYREVLAEAVAPNLGRYTATLDDTIDETWYLFVGATQPSNWTEAVEVFDIAQTSGGGSGTGVSIVGSIVDRGSETTIVCYYGEAIDVTITTSEDLSALTLRMAIEDMQTRTDKLVIEDGDLTKTSTTIAATITTAVTNKLGQYIWSLRNALDDGVLLRGVLSVDYAAKKDA